MKKLLKILFKIIVFLTILLFGIIFIIVGQTVNDLLIEVVGWTISAIAPIVGAIAE